MIQGQLFSFFSIHLSGDCRGVSEQLFRNHEAKGVLVRLTAISSGPVQNVTITLHRFPKCPRASGHSSGRGIVPGECKREAGGKHTWSVWMWDIKAMHVIVCLREAQQ